MSKPQDVPFEVTHLVRDTCLCLHVQRAARGLAKRFDDALRPVGLTNGQFSLMMSLNRPAAAGMGDVAALLGMDRTTLTAKLKPLVRRGLVEVTVDAGDRRGRRLMLTAAGRTKLAEAVPLWRSSHAEIEAQLPRGGAERLRSELRALD